MMALVTASGMLGLSAVFPPASTTFTNPSSEGPEHLLPPPHLPLTPTWEETDFSLENVMSTTAFPGQEINLREYCMKLMSRYLYISGE
jgi:3-O-alpha-D-mannopyranosyl-alpha-D-mannopyranose xylosylphosphotransferase